MTATCLEMLLAARAATAHHAPIEDGDEATVCEHGNSRCPECVSRDRECEMADRWLDERRGT